jgi:hypothetical protein
MQELSIEFTFSDMDSLKGFLADWDLYQSWKIKKMSKKNRDCSHIRELHRLAKLIQAENKQLYRDCLKEAGRIFKSSKSDKNETNIINGTD